MYLNTSQPGGSTSCRSCISGETCWCHAGVSQTSLVSRTHIFHLAQEVSEDLAAVTVNVYPHGVQPSYHWQRNGLNAYPVVCLDSMRTGYVPAWAEYISRGIFRFHEDQWRTWALERPFTVWRLRSDLCWTVLIPVMCLIHVNTPLPMCSAVRSGFRSGIRSPLFAAA